jgi:Myb/SANT-like DNA-binding domain
MPPSTSDTPRRPSAGQENPLSKAASTSTLDPAHDTPMSTGKIRRGPNAKWTSTDIDSLITQLLQAKNDGYFGEGGFKATVWKAIADSYNDPLKKKYRAAESKWARLKKEYKDIKWLREEVPGFDWDDKKHIVSATGEVWAELGKVISDYSPYYC